QLVEGLLTRPPRRRRSVEIDRWQLDRIDISGSVNLPPPRLWRRCPVLHHDRIVSALVIQVVHWRNYVLDVHRFLGRIWPGRAAKDGPWLTHYAPVRSIRPDRLNSN